MPVLWTSTSIKQVSRIFLRLVHHLKPRLSHGHLLDATLSHKVFVEIASPHYGKSVRSHYAKNVLNVTLDSCGCNFVAGKNEEEPLACGQPALRRLLSNALGNTAWQPCNPQQIPNSHFSQRASFQSTAKSYETFFFHLYICVYFWILLLYFLCSNAVLQNWCCLVGAGYGCWWFLVDVDKTVSP